MPEKLLKITYQGEGAGNGKKLNAYLRMPSQNYGILRREIDLYLFQERQLPKCEIRTFWIDIDNDEIEIVNQNDYEIFLSKCGQNMHLQIAPLVTAEQATKNEATPASPPSADDDPSNFIIHDGVECDSCGLLPLVGFRYKCVQCQNFDLCQGCEAAHKHPEHLMVRMPTNNGPSVVEAWLSGPGTSGRRGGRRHRGQQCPFGEAAQAAAAAAQAAGTTPATTGESSGLKDSRRERRHARRHGGVLSQFMEMMMNLPESNTPATPAASTPAAASTVTPTAATATPAASSATPVAAPAPAAATPAAPATAPAENKNIKVTPTNEPSIVAQAVNETEAKPAASFQETPKPDEPVAAPRSKEPESASAPPTGTPTTPVINLENLSQIVPPEYMRAGIEILNNFSEMFAKMIDPSESVGYGSFEAGAASHSTTEPKKTPQETTPANDPISASTSASTTASTSAESSLKDEPQLTEPLLEQQSKIRSRTESLDQEWQMIDNSGSTVNNFNSVASSDALINLDTAGSTVAAPAVAPSAPASETPVASASSAAVPNFGQLGELLRQHVTEEQQREQATAHTQTSEVDTVTTSTSTNPVATNSTGTSTAVPQEKIVYHSDERINTAIHALMAMGFSNEGAWLTQLMESVNGDIPAALDIMLASQRRN